MNIEQEVREMLSSKVRRAPALDEPPQPVLRRARTRRVMNSVALTMVVGLLATGSVLGVRSLGTSGTIEPVVPGPGKVVPWAALAPGKAASFRPCRADDVTFVADPGGSPGFIVTAKNDRVACKIDNQFGMRVYDAGKRMNIPVAKGPTFTRAIITDPSLAQMLIFSWKNECAPNDHLLTYELVLPDGGGTLRSTAMRLGESNLADLNDCNTLRGATTMTFIDVVTVDAGPPHKNPLDNLVVELSVPESAPAGQVFKYTVTLSNRTARAVSLINCPSIEQRLSVADRIERRLSRLNCDAAPSVWLPQTAVTFAMEFEIPGDLALWQNPSLPTIPPRVQAVIGWRFQDSPATGGTGAFMITPFSG